MDNTLAGSIPVSPTIFMILQLIVLIVGAGAVIEEANTDHKRLRKVLTTILISVIVGLVIAEIGLLAE